MCSPPKISIKAPKGPKLSLDIPTWGDVERTVQDVGKNLEQAGQRFTQGAAQIVSGNWDNAGNWLLESAAAMGTGGLSAAMGYKAGQTGVERKQEKMADQAQADYDAAVQAARDQELADVRATITGIVDQRRRAPGRQQTLLGSRGGSGTLLTPA